MPLERIIQVDSTTQLLIWKITEDFDTLSSGLDLREASQMRLENMRSISHQCGFLSIRHLLMKAGYSDFDLQYDSNGKPSLSDGKYISITHSFNFSGIIISSQNVGIDIEMQREKIIRIADKFISAVEQQHLVEDLADKIKQLTVVWGAKEAMYKMCNSRSLSFKDDMRVLPFEIHSDSGCCVVDSNDFSKVFRFYFLEIENFITVYTLPIPS